MKGIVQAQKTDTYRLDVLFFKEKDMWVGQCLQHDLVSDGGSLRECMNQFAFLLVGRILVASELGTAPFENIPPAPQRFWERYHRAVRVRPEEPAFELPGSVPPAFMIDSSQVEIRID